MTAYRFDKPDPAQPIELWPRLLDREPHRLAVEGFHRDHDARYHRTSINLRKIFDTHDLLGSSPLGTGVCPQLAHAWAKHETLEHWLASIPDRANNPAVGERMTAQLHSAIALEPADKDGAPAEARRQSRGAAGAFAVLCPHREAIV